MKQYWSKNGRFYTLFIITFGLTILFSPTVTSQTINLVNAPTCTGTNTDIIGTVFRDYNADGRNSFGNIEPGIEGITVTAYDTNNNVVYSCETRVNGTYDLNIGANFPVRLEISNIPAYLQPGPAGIDSETTVTFVSGTASGVDFGLANPAQYCEATNNLSTTCFVNGSAANFGGGPNDTLVQWAYSLRGELTAPTHISERDNIGSAWGLAYDRDNQQLYTSAFLKRYVGLRSGLGAIFVTDPFGPAPNGSLFVDVAAPPFNLDVGEIGTDAARGLVSDPAARANDPTSFYAIGKVGLADLAISEDNQSLWFINLFNKTLYSLEIDSDNNPGTPPTAADLQAFPIPTSQCNSYTSLYLNAGGTNFATLVDPAWNGDGYQVGGTSGTTTGSPGAPYNTNRTDPTTFDYIVPLPDGNYNVTLHVYSNSAVSFDATVEGVNQVITVPANTPYSELRNITVTDGMMNFTFDNATIGVPTINGIQITSTGTQVFNETAPFGLKMNDGSLYLSLVCTAEYSQDVTQLDAYIYRLANETLPFTQVTTFDLDYTKGFASTSGTCDQNGASNWHPWATSQPAICGHPVFSPGRTVWPQPMPSGLEFDIDGSLIINFMDRLGHQLGNFNFELTGTELREGVIGGDLLRLYNNNGTYELENNATVGPLTAAWLTPSQGVNNNEGPGGGEFYQDDVDPPRSHREISVGGLAYIHGSGEVVATVMDPVGDPESGGVLFFDNMRGSSTTGPAENSFDGYEVYQSTGTATFGKANGLGDLVLLCAPPPIAIGNRVWRDLDSDGVQDANEVGINGVTLGLYDAGGILLASIVTANDPQGKPGFYQFIGDGSDGATWVNANDAVQPNTTYTIAIYNSNFSGGALDGLIMSANDQNPDSLATPDIRDSDGIVLSVGTGANAAARGISLTTGNAGENNHTYDFGFFANADWGDAPDAPYPTVFAVGSNANHALVPGGPYLGSCVDSELDGQPNAAATGDDGAIGATVLGACTNNNDDEDGVLFSSPLVPGMAGSVEMLMITSPASCLLNAWIDFDGSGTWGDLAGEQIASDLVLATGSVTPVNFTVPPTAVTGTLVGARFRCDVGGGLTPTSPSPNGEVEDYLVLIDTVVMDFGDLPDGYGTIITSDGGRHIINTLRLGATEDAEATGNPSIGADGDDDAASDDEDGIFIGGPGSWGDGTGNLDATVAIGSGCLVGWVDFNGDGDFDDDVFDGVGTVSENILSVFRSPGTTTEFFPAPLSPAFGGTYVYPNTLNMRYRLFPPNDPLFVTAGLSLDGNGCPDATNTTLEMEVISTGLASDGEIEDYVQGFGPTAVTLQTPFATSNAPKWLNILVIFMALALITFILLPQKRLVGKK